MIPRISEALDAELLKQGGDARMIDANDLDAERLAIAAIEELATQLANEGFQSPARWLRSKIGETGT